jgi:SAM-dependent methyltransferase
MKLVFLQSLLFLGMCLTTFASEDGARRCERFVTLFSNTFFSNAMLSPWIAESSPIEASALWDTYVRILLDGKESTDVARTAELLNRLSVNDRVMTLRKIFGRVLVYQDSYRDTLIASDEVIPSAGLVADIGCGGGLTCAYLAFDRPDRRFILMDHNPTLPFSARTNLNAVTTWMGLPNDRNQVIRGDARRFGIASERVNAFVANFVFQHLGPRDQKALMHQMSSALVPGGVVVIHESILNYSPFRDPYYEEALRMENAIRRGAIYTRADLWMLAALRNGRLSESHDPPDMVLGSSLNYIKSVAESEGLVLIQEPFYGVDYSRLILQKSP